MVAHHNVALGKAHGVRSSPQVTIAKVMSISHTIPEPEAQSEEQHDLAESLQQSLQHQCHNGEVAFWNVNIAGEDHTVECPAYLSYAQDNVKDLAILSTPDNQYRRQTWEEVQGFIRRNRLDLFTRVPSELRLYRKYCHKLIQDFGSIMKFVLDERLKWGKLEPSNKPFRNPEDYKILYNDWPYGVDERIVHLVVWTKFELPADPVSKIGDMSAETRDLVADFVDEAFVRTCGSDNVIWFKNWQSLKSVHAVEHFHVMIFDPDMEFIQAITKGDVPLFQKVKVAKENGTA